MTVTKVCTCWALGHLKHITKNSFNLFKTKLHHLRFTDMCRIVRYVLKATGVMIVLYLISHQTLPSVDDSAFYLKWLPIRLQEYYGKRIIFSSIFKSSVVVTLIDTASKILVYFQEHSITQVFWNCFTLHHHWFTSFSKLTTFMTLLSKSPYKIFSYLFRFCFKMSKVYSKPQNSLKHTFT